MIIFRHFAKISSNIFHIICQNLIRQFLKVTFNEIFCKLALFLFYGTPAYYIASGNSCWLLWPKCWLETEFDNRFRLRFSMLIQLILGKCESSRNWDHWLRVETLFISRLRSGWEMGPCSRCSVAQFLSSYPSHGRSAQSIGQKFSDRNNIFRALVDNLWYDGLAIFQLYNCKIAL